MKKIIYKKKKMAVDRQTIHCQPPNGGALVNDFARGANQDQHNFDIDIDNE